MPRRCDIWRVGIVRATVAEVATTGLEAHPIHWLAEEPSFRFLADPFGLWRGGQLHLFAEYYDYRSRHGVIDRLTFGADLTLRDRATVLRESWHLSYPYVFEADGETWMLPEAYRSGALTLYRAIGFPDRWEPAARITLDVPPIDASPLWHGGRWWLFYSGGRDRKARMGAFHIASAERLEGPWYPHPHNPIRCDMRGGRPGGTPFLDGDIICLPVQDCSRTYGGAVRILRFSSLTPDRVKADLGPPISAPMQTPYRDGFHTLSGCGPVTLIDAKKVDQSGRGWLIDLARAVGLTP